MRCALALLVLGAALAGGACGSTTGPRSDMGVQVINATQDSLFVFSSENGPTGHLRGYLLPGAQICWRTTAQTTGLAAFRDTTIGSVAAYQPTGASYALAPGGGLSWPIPADARYVQTPLC